MSKNRMTGGGAGGGPGSRAMHAPTTYFTGHPGTKVSPKGVSQFGGSYGDHATASGKVLRGAIEPVKMGSMPNGGPGGVPLGVEVAQSTVCGPGGSRTVMRSGGQAQHGPVAGTVRPPGRSFDDRG
jgi:hypothetical protein